MENLINSVTKFTLEQVYEELHNIQKDLNWLDDDIVLTKEQRRLFNDIKNRVKTVLRQSGGL